jgi:polyadenylate-binding protein
MLLEGKKVYVGPFLKSDDRPANHELRYTNVFVKNLQENIDDDELMGMFAEHGAVTSAVVMKVCAAGSFAESWAFSC